MLKSNGHARLAVCAGLSLAIITGQVPLAGIVPVAAATPATADGQTAADAQTSVADLLAAEPYTEHEAIVLVRGGAMLPQEATRTGGTGTQELMDISSGALAEIADKDSAPAALAEAASAPSLQSNDEGAAARIVFVHDESKTTEQLLGELLELDGVLAAEPNYRYESTDGDAESTFVQTAAGAGAESGTIADGTEFQWGKYNNGRMGGLDSSSRHPDVNYPAWNQDSAPASSDGPVVAVLDSGVDGSHPDLSNKLWDAPAELQELWTGSDEHGYSPKDGASTVVEELGDGHGTHVAGIIAAEWNDFGISGTSKNAQIMSLEHNSDALSIIACLAYVADAQKLGEEVVAINASFGIGGGTATIMDAAITEVGQDPNNDGKGAIMVFATGNSGTDVDNTAYSASLLSENPYTVFVNSIDADGGLSAFSNYGEKTTDLAAPGSASLSTYPVQEYRYYGELDDAPTLYESFDDQSAQTGMGLTFRTADHFAEEDPEDQLAPIDNAFSFDGDSSMIMIHDIDGSDAAAGEFHVEATVSDAIDISEARAAGRANCLSLHYRGVAGENLGGEKAIDNVSARLAASVKMADGSWQALAGQKSNPLDASWGAMSYELPDGADYSAFQLKIEGVVIKAEFLTDTSQITPIPGTVWIDSIGIGSNLAPYTYLQGTSMAAPEVTGAAAVIAEQLPGVRGEALAARVRGAVSQGGSGGGDIDGTCLSNGILDISAGINNPAPAIAEVEAADGKLNIWGYWFPAQENVEVRLGGEVLKVKSMSAAERDQTMISCELPENFAGGQLEVVVHDTSDGQYGRAFPVLGANEDAALYEHDLSLPAGIENWEKMQLVGFNGRVYAFPQASIFNSNEERHGFFLRYDPKKNTWEQVALPEEVLASVEGVGGKVVHLTATPWDGRLAVYVGGTEKTALWTYAPDGTWEHLGSWGAISEESPYQTNYGTIAASGGDTGRGELFVFGAVDGNWSTSHVMAYNPETSQWEECGQLNGLVLSPAVSYADGTFLVSGGFNLLDQGALAQGVERVTINDDGTLTSELLDLSALYEETGAQAVATGALADGFALVGPTSHDGKADTYLLSRDDATSHGKRASDLALLAPSACTYDGMLYVFSAVQGDGFVFRATAVNASVNTNDAANVTALREAYEKAQAIDTSLFTDETVEVFQAAFLRAQAMLEGDPAVFEQAAVDECAADLAKVIDGLVKKSDSQDPEDPSDPAKPGTDTDTDTGNGKPGAGLPTTGDASVAGMLIAAGSGLAALAAGLRRRRK